MGNLCDNCTHMQEYEMGMGYLCYDGEYHNNVEACADFEPKCVKCIKDLGIKAKSGEIIHGCAEGPVLRTTRCELFTPADKVDHPSYYQGNIEVIDFIEDKGLGFHLGNAIKYIARAGRKSPDTEVEDLRKAIWYIERYIKQREEE